MSNTSLSCAMSCVFTLRVVMSHTVHVVSMEDVAIWLGSVQLQSKDVTGAQYSLFLFCGEGGRGVA